MKSHPVIASIATICWSAAGPAFAQGAPSAVASATDGFGSVVGNERVGVYTVNSVRGFNPIVAGNRRLEGLYFDLGGNGLTGRLIERSTVRVGLPALTFPFPAPSGIVDYDLRTASGRNGLTAVVIRPPYGGLSVELDGEAPISDNLAIAGGIAKTRNRYVDGRSTDIWSAAILPHLNAGKLDVVGFLGVARSGGSVPPIMVTTGRLPPLVNTSRFRSQRWIDNDQLSFTYGALGSFKLADDLSVQLGLYESKSTRRTTYTNLFTSIGEDGSAIERVISDPRLPARWTSGESRLVWDQQFGEFKNKLILSVRGRDKRLESGGSALAILGPARIGRLTPAPEPDFNYRDPLINKARQLQVGLATIGHFRKLDFNVGIQRAFYRSDTSSGGDTARVKSSPFLYNATLAYSPKSWLGFYAGATRGLEENAPAPASASNRDEPVPAARTDQLDAGARILVGGLRVVVGGFTIKRPYYGVAADNIYRKLGAVRNKGLEFSVAGKVGERLSLVSGLVLMDPRTGRPPNGTEGIVYRPVNSTTRIGRIDAEYALGQTKKASLLLGVQHTGPLAASTGGYAELDGEQLKVAAGTTFDLGGRLKFNVGKVALNLQGRILNLTDVRRFNVASSNAFISPERRRWTLQLNADF